MATDYNTLLADIDDWLIREDVSVKSDRLIQLAEDRHVGDIRVRAQLKRSRANGNGTVYLPLPLGYIDMRRMIYTTATPYELIQVSPEGMSDRVRANANTRISYYAIHEELEFDQPLLTTEEVEMVYWARFTRLSSSNLTNWLVENAYGCYLYGALVAAAPYVADDERVQLWEQEYAKHVAAVEGQNNAGRISAAPRVVVTGETP